METIAYLTKFVLCAAGVFIFLIFAGWLVWKVGQGKVKDKGKKGVLWVETEGPIWNNTAPSSKLEIKTK